jgi:hypothetical protein
VFTAAEREQVLGALMRFADREEFDAHHERRAGTDARMAGSMSG